MVKDDKRESICNYNSFQQLRYVQGLLLDADDFQDQQTYYIQKRRLLNRMLYGCGVVCGLGVQGKKEETSLTITPGFALDCCGNEIWVDKEVVVSLKDLKAQKDKEEKQGKSAEECADPAEQEKVRSWYLCVAYTQIETDRKPVYSTCNGGDDKACETTRVREGFCFQLMPQGTVSFPPSPDGLFKKLCDCHQKTQRQPAGSSIPEQESPQETSNCVDEAIKEFCGSSVACPQCGDAYCPSHCVVLAKIDIKNCRIEGIDINHGRTYVLSASFLRHVLGRTLSGVEGFFSKSGREPSSDYQPSFARNPFEAICWFLKHWVAQPRMTLTDEAKRCFKWLGGWKKDEEYSEKEKEKEKEREKEEYRKQECVKAVKAQVREDYQRKFDEMNKMKEEYEKELQSVRKKLESLEKDMGEVRKIKEDKEKELQSVREKLGSLEEDPAKLKTKKDKS